MALGRVEVVVSSLESSSWKAGRGMEEERWVGVTEDAIAAHTILNVWIY